MPFDKIFFFGIMQTNLERGIQMSPRRVDPKLKKQSQSGLPTWVIAVGIGILVVVAVVVLFTLQTPSTSAPVTVGSGSTSASRTKGSPDAKIAFVEYSDFQ